MNYIISLKGQEQEEIQISQKDYDTISKFLNQVRLFKLESGEIIDSSQIRRIKPLPEQQTIFKEFRLPEGREDKEELIKVPGGFQKPSVRENMIRLFNRMKEQGLFKGFNSYEKWEEAKYKEG